MKCLVTGGCGFVGRHLIKRLLDKGFDVVCVDPVVKYTGGICPIKNNGWPLYNPLDYARFKYLNEDCRSFFMHCQDSYDYVFHLAAMVGGREMIEHNPLAVAEDLAIDSDFWRWARNVKPKKIICFSSSAAYPIKYQGKNDYILLKENLISFNDDIGIPDLSYGWAKLTHEYLAKLAYHHHGLSSIVYRPFSGYGEDQDLAYPFPSICRRALHGKSDTDFQVWGTGYQMRDFIYIEDCISGIIETMDKIDDASPVNLSTGILTSFNDFAKIATSIVGYNPRIYGTSNKPEGVFARGGDTDFQIKLGFKAKLKFHEGIKLGINYQDKIGK